MLKSPSILAGANPIVSMPQPFGAVRRSGAPLRWANGRVAWHRTDGRMARLEDERASKTVGERQAEARGRDSPGRESGERTDPSSDADGGEHRTGAWRDPGQDAELGRILEAVAPEADRRRR